MGNFINETVIQPNNVISALQLQQLFAGLDGALTTLKARVDFGLIYTQQASYAAGAWTTTTTNTWQELPSWQVQHTHNAQHFALCFFSASIGHSTAGANIGIAFVVDGVVMGTPAQYGQYHHVIPGTNHFHAVTVVSSFLLAAGTHTIKIAFKNATTGSLSVAPYGATLASLVPEIAL